LAIEEFRVRDTPVSSPKWTVESRIDLFIGLCAIAVSILVVIKNLVIGYYALAALISTLTAMLAVDVFFFVRSRWLPIPVPAILIVLDVAILVTIWYFGSQGALWAFPTIVGGTLVKPRGVGFYVALSLVATVPAMVMWQGDTTMAIRLVLALSLTAGYMWFSVRKTLELQDKLMAASTRDPLTGSYNLRHLDEIADQMTDTCVSVLLIDIDHFKKVNDSLGHATGDMVLKQVSSLMFDLLGSNGSLFRVGGDEFLVLLDDHTDGQVLAGLICSRISEAEILPDRTITVSIGQVQKWRGETVQDAQRRADKQLYFAKQQGRNRVCSG